MSTRSVSFCFLFCCLTIVATLSGCHSNTPASPDRLSFKDEKSMRKALTGTWILQEYQDSTDAGLTPKLLEYMLDSENSINYFEGEQGATIGGYTTEAYHLSEKKQIDMMGYGSDLRYEFTSTTFDYRNNTLSFYTRDKPKVREPQPTHLIGTAKFIIVDSDTLLSFQKDSNSRPRNFIKYPANPCEYNQPYTHLVNSKFIAGKYFLESDTAGTHHIIFTKCGDVEGAGYIDRLLHASDRYKIVLGEYESEPDKLIFWAGTVKDEWSWQRDHDSLILEKKDTVYYRNLVTDKTQTVIEPLRIVLVRAR